MAAFIQRHRRKLARKGGIVEITWTTTGVRINGTSYTTLAELERDMK